MDFYSNPYITHYTSFQISFPFLHGQLTKGKYWIQSGQVDHSSMRWELLAQRREKEGIILGLYWGI